MIVPMSPYAANTLHYPALELLLPFRKEKPQKNITTRQTMRKSQIIYKILAFFWNASENSGHKPPKAPHSQECQGFCRGTGHMTASSYKAVGERGAPRAKLRGELWVINKPAAY